jgi:hypothetical protein
MLEAPSALNAREGVKEASNSNTNGLQMGHWKSRNADGGGLSCVGMWLKRKKSTG